MVHFPAGKLPVRGLFRVTCMMIAATAMTNVRRIQRYVLRTRPKPPERQENRRKMRRSSVPALAAHFRIAFLAVGRVAFRQFAAPTLRFSS